MDARVTCCEALWEALTWRVRLKGASRRGQCVPTILSAASEVTTTWNGPPKLEGLVAEGFRGSIEWLRALSGDGGGRVIDPSQKIRRIHVRRAVSAVGGRPTKN